MRGAGGWETGTEGGVVCSGATRADGFSSVGVFAAAGKTGSCSTGAGGAAGAIGMGGGKTGEGTCGFSSHGCFGRGCFSEAGKDIVGGKFSASGDLTPISC